MKAIAAALFTANALRVARASFQTAAMYVRVQTRQILYVTTTAAGAFRHLKTRSKQNTITAITARKGQALPLRIADPAHNKTARGRGIILPGIRTTVITIAVRRTAVRRPRIHLPEAAAQDLVRVPAQVPAEVAGAGTNIKFLTG